jgi:hypothetical protein
VTVCILSTCIYNDLCDQVHLNNQEVPDPSESSPNPSLGHDLVFENA